MKNDLRKLLDDAGFNNITLVQCESYYRIAPLNNIGRSQINRSESVGGYNCFYGNYENKSNEAILDKVNYFINYKNNCNIKINF